MLWVDYIIFIPYNAVHLIFKQFYKERIKTDNIQQKWSNSTKNNSSTYSPHNPTHFSSVVANFFKRTHNMKYYTKYYYTTR